MRTLRLLLWFCVGLLIGGYSVASHAAVDVCKAALNGQIRYYGGGVAAWNSICQEYGDWANARDVAAGGKAKIYNPDPGLVPMAGCTSTVICRYGTGANDWASTGWMLAGIVKTCPDGTLPNRSTGECSATNCPGDQKADPVTGDCKCDSGQGKYKGYSATVPGGYPTGVCVNGCMQSPGSTGIGMGGSTTVWLGASTGKTCTGTTIVTPPPSSNSPSPNTPTSCIEQGQGYVTANGKTTCVTNGPNSPTSTTTTKNEDPDGPNGPTAPTNTETKTQCEGDKCTTTTTTSGPNGTTTKTESDSKINFCAEQPNHLLCQNKPDYCEKNPDALGCQKGTLTKGTPGKFEETQGEVTEAKGKWESAIGQIKGEASGLLQVAAGSGSLPNFGSVEVLGKPISMDLARYSDQLQWVVFSLLLMAHVAAVLIALG